MLKWFILSLLLSACTMHKFHVPFEECISFHSKDDNMKMSLCFQSFKFDEVFIPMAGTVYAVNELSENHYEVELNSANGDTAMTIGPLASEHRLVEKGDLLVRGQMIGHAADKLNDKPIIYVSILINGKSSLVKHQWFHASHFKKGPN